MKMKKMTRVSKFKIFFAVAFLRNNDKIKPKVQAM